MTSPRFTSSRGAGRKSEKQTELGFFGLFSAFDMAPILGICAKGGSLFGGNPHC